MAARSGAWVTPCPRTGQASDIQQIPIGQIGRGMGSDILVRVYKVRKLVSLSL